MPRHFDDFILTLVMATFWSIVTRFIVAPSSAFLIFFTSFVAHGSDRVKLTAQRNAEAISLGFPKTEPLEVSPDVKDFACVYNAPRFRRSGEQFYGYVFEMF